MYRYLLFISLFFSFHSTHASVSIPLNDHWEFKRVGDSASYKAVVPGSVHLDLMQNGLIPDPFIGDNENKVQWVDTATWEYKCTFQVSSKWLKSNHAALVFEGLDTYAEVTLNGVKVLSSSNMFRSYSIDVHALLKSHDNILVVKFTPASREALNREKNNGVKIPGGERVFSRKAAYQWGWDFGPRLLGCGIWKPVRLMFWQNAKIEEVRLQQKIYSDTLAQLVVSTAVSSDIDDHLIYNYTIDPSGESLIINKHLFPGENIFSDTILIRQPKLWWTNELGVPYCYKANVAIERNGKVLDSRKITFGLRSLELVQEPDSLGSSFYFKLNGVPVFMKGANLVPIDHFMSCLDSAKITALLNEAQHSHFNMIRVWGGGVYPSDDFFNECDKRGILVWQDFMSACSMLPGDTAFIQDFEVEALQQVRRIRNHPSLAIWCGNNENNEGWHNWGWQKELNYSMADSAQVWQDYLKIFHQMLPHVIEKENSETAYWPSSPSIGWGHKESLLSGDAHYWGVWWGMEPFQVYTEKTGRFMTEYGFQGMPNANTVRKFTNTTFTDTTQPQLKNHQKHPTGFQTIQTYMDRWFNHPKDFSSYIYVSQLLQAEGIVTAIEAHRRKMPYCMGTLYWQLNDTWPGISWSSVDYYGDKKALHYALQNAYSRLLISTVISPQRKADIYVVTDSLQDYLARMELRIIDFRGNVRWSEIVPAAISANSSSLVCSRDLSRIVQGSDTSFCLLNVRIIFDNKTLTETNSYFCLPKNFRLSRPAMTVRPIKNENGRIGFAVKSSYFVKAMEFTLNGNNTIFDKNFIDMIPGQTYEIAIDKDGIVTDDISKIQFRSLIDTY